MKITCAPNGPYLSEGVSLRRENGAALEAGGKVALCRCGG